MGQLLDPYRSHSKGTPTLLHTDLDTECAAERRDRAWMARVLWILFLRRSGDFRNVAQPYVLKARAKSTFVIWPWRQTACPHDFLYGHNRIYTRNIPPSLNTPQFVVSANPGVTRGGLVPRE